tara:strand:- start:66 stop:305 length:240 start_codon:yes stop_codon:yes gene_type:complete
MNKKNIYAFKGIKKSGTLDVVATIKNEINWIKATRKKFFWKNYRKEKPLACIIYEDLRKNIIALNKVVKQLEKNQKDFN